MQEAQNRVQLDYLKNQLMEEQDQVVELSKKNSTLQQEVLDLKA